MIDDFSHARAARFALERALVMIRPVGLKSREPHRHSALGTPRVLNIGRVGNVVRLSHCDSPFAFKQAGALQRLSATSAYGQSLGR